MSAVRDGSSAPGFRVEEGLCDLKQPVQAAPYKVGQTAAVPESAHEESDHKIQTVPPFGNAAAAQRDIDIVPEPGGERDVPPAPKFLDGEGEVGTLEVGHQVDAEQLGAAYGYVGVAGKIAVDLYGEHDCGDDKHKSHIGVRIVIYLVDYAGKDVGDHQFLEIAPGHQFQAVGRVRVGEGALFLILRQQAVGSADGPGQKLREERHEERIVAEMPFRLALAAVDVDQVTHGLEKIERDARGEQDLQSDGLHVQPSRVDQRVQTPYGGPGGLVEEQDQHERQDSCKETAPF